MGKKDTHWMGVFVYPSKGRKYFRFMWGTGDAVHGAVHIAGGNVDSLIAKRRAVRVKQAIDRGDQLESILNMIATFTNARPGRRG